MTSHNQRSKRPVVTLRCSPDVYAALQARVSDDVTLAHLAELYLVAGLEADGVKLKRVSAEQRVARRIAVEVMQEVGQAVNAAVATVLARHEGKG